jgi:hypothetical protein
LLLLHLLLLLLLLLSLLLLRQRIHARELPGPAPVVQERPVVEPAHAKGNRLSSTAIIGIGVQCSSDYYHAGAEVLPHQCTLSPFVRSRGGAVTPVRYTTQRLSDPASCHYVATPSST